MCDKVNQIAVLRVGIEVSFSLKRLQERGQVWVHMLITEKFFCEGIQYG